MRFIIVGRLRSNANPFNYYITSSGCTSSTPEKAAVLRSIEDARLERDYHNRGNERHQFHIEKLPARMKIENAVLKSVDVE